MGKILSAWDGATTPTFTGLATQANNSQVTSSVIDLTGGGYIGQEAQFSFTSGTVSASGFIEFWLLPSVDNSSFATPFGAGRLIARENVTVSTTAFVFTWTLPIGDCQFFKIVSNNQTGAAYASAVFKIGNRFNTY